MAEATPHTWHMMASDRVTDWQIVHEQPLHGFWVSADLRQFRHFHPPVDRQGRFLWMPPQQAGKALFTGVSQRQGPVEATMETQADTAGGSSGRPIAVPLPGWQASDRQPALWGQLKRDGNSQVSLWLSDARGLPLPGVEALMDAPAHAIITDPQLSQLTHAHPTTPLVNTGAGQKKALLPLAFHTPPSTGQPAVWFVQVRWQGQVHTFKLLA